MNFNNYNINTSKESIGRGNHKCEFDNELGAWGASINQCFEDGAGHFWVINEEYATQVNFCPECGEEAPTKAVKK